LRTLPDDRVHAYKQTGSGQKLLPLSDQTARRI